MNMDFNTIDGFAIDCGDENRVITLKNEIFTIGCFEGTLSEAMRAIKSKYVTRDAREYIGKLYDCMSMVWYEKCEWSYNIHNLPFMVQKALAKYSDEYHHLLKDSRYWVIRRVVAQYSDKYHDQFKSDEHWAIRHIGQLGTRCTPDN